MTTYPHMRQAATTRTLVQTSDGYQIVRLPEDEGIRDNLMVAVCETPTHEWHDFDGFDEAA